MLDPKQYNSQTYRFYETFRSCFSRICDPLGRPGARKIDTSRSGQWFFGAFWPLFTCLNAYRISSSKKTWKKSKNWRILASKPLPKSILKRVKIEVPKHICFIDVFSMKKICFQTSKPWNISILPRKNHYFQRFQCHDVFVLATRFGSKNPSKKVSKTKPKRWQNPVKKGLAC